MRIMLTCLLCLALFGSAVAAERTVTVTPVEGPILNAGFAGTSAVCNLGNQNAAYYSIPDWIYGAESYATQFQADPQACSCPGGFAPEMIHFLMNFEAEDVPVSFDATVSFHENTFDAVAGCNVPGDVICESPAYTVNITNPGLYDIALPIDPSSCPCSFFDYSYAISMNFLTAFTEYPAAITDNAPVGCVSWNDYGLGWLDLQSFGFPGETVMWADIVCCEPAVPTEEKTWDELKSMFR